MNEEKFFRDVNRLLDQEKIRKQERKARGESFNIFQIMSMSSDEVHTHSAIIASLLDPKGVHGCGDVFLKLFIEQIPQLQELDMDTYSAHTHIEYAIGNITSDYEHGGRIDILISSKDKAIIIENKIYASDQPKQMWRYYDYAETHYSQGYKLLYLTLNGKNASKDSITGSRGVLIVDEHYSRLSYREDIISWIEKCIEKVSSKPLVRETLVQYNNLLKKLTYQDMDHKLESQLAELCAKPENIEAFVWMYKHFESISEKITMHFANLSKQILKEYGGTWGDKKRIEQGWWFFYNNNWCAKDATHIEWNVRLENLFAQNDEKIQYTIRLHVEGWWNRNAKYTELLKQNLGDLYKSDNKTTFWYDEVIAPKPLGLMNEQELENYLREVYTTGDIKTVIEAVIKTSNEYTINASK